MLSRRTLWSARRRPRNICSISVVCACIAEHHLRLQFRPVSRQFRSRSKLAHGEGPHRSAASERGAVILITDRGVRLTADRPQERLAWGSPYGCQRALHSSQAQTPALPRRGVAPEGPRGRIRANDAGGADIREILRELKPAQDDRGRMSGSATEAERPPRRRAHLCHAATYPLGVGYFQVRLKRVEGSVHVSGRIHPDDSGSADIREVQFASLRAGPLRVETRSGWHGGRISCEAGQDQCSERSGVGGALPGKGSM